MNVEQIFATQQIGFPILSALMLIPLLGALALLFVPRGRRGFIMQFAALITLIDFAVSIPLWTRFVTDRHCLQFVERLSWIPSIGVDYFIGIDGVSVLLVLLTTFLGFLATLSSWSYIKERVKEYYIFLLLLQTGMLGVFVSMDLFLFYVFWEVMLVPMYFLIGVWGGPRKLYAAIKFFLYTLTGSVLMLVAILALYFYNHAQTGVFTFDVLALHRLSLPLAAQRLIFLAFFVAFAIKVPMFPFHTWLPDAHVEAPTAGSVILAGVLLKMGCYGFLRFSLPIMPQATREFLGLLVVLSIVGIVYGALVAMMQPDIKKLVAYSSVSHLGFVMLGIFALNMQGLKGAVLQMINHGLSTGALFLAVGILYERRHTRLIVDFGGLSRQVPVFAVFFLIVTLSSIGLPGLNGFIGEFLILLGAFRANIVWAVIAASGIVLGAAYMLWMFQRVMFGKLDNPENQNLKDMNLREWVYMLPIVIMMFVIGLYPKPFLEMTDKSVEHLLGHMERKAAMTVQAAPAAGVPYAWARPADRTTGERSP